jgi:hypothetical protein
VDNNQADHGKKLESMFIGARRPYGFGSLSSVLS